MDKLTILSEIKTRLEALHKERLKGVILYGSFARGDEHEDSDVDVLVLLDGPVDHGEDLMASIKAVYSFGLELGHPISLNPTDIEEFRNYDCPLYREVKREGISA